MRRHTAVLALASLLWISFSSIPASSQQQTPARLRAILTKPYTPQLGDMIALTTAQLMTSLKATSTPTLAAYDRNLKKIVIYVYGQRATLDRAKSTLDAMRDNMAEMMELVGEIYGVSLDPKDFQYAYYDLTSEKELVHWADGAYTIGEEKPAEGE